MHLSIAILTYFIGIVWVVVWAYLRSRAPLAGKAPQSDWDLAARFIYVLGYLVSFIGLTGFLVFGGDLAAQLIQTVATSLGWLGDINTAFGKQIIPVAPLFAVGAIQLGLKIAPLGQLDATVLAWLHSAEHLDEEISKLRAALVQRPFQPNEEEVDQNRSKLQAHDIRLTGSGFVDSDLEVIKLWRKTACLLRHVEDWSNASPDLLDEGEKAELRDIKDADDRKLKHAVNIIKALTLSRRFDGGHGGAGNPRRPDGRRLAGNPRPAIAAQGGQALVYSGAEESLAQDPFEAGDAIAELLPPGAESPYAIEMDPGDFLDVIEKIQHYFIKEYDIILERVCSLAAKAIVHSGHNAEKRLEEIKEAGFTRLGSLKRLSIDTTIKFFCSTMILVCFSAVLFFVLGDHGGPDPATILKMGLGFGFAILCGAMIGSNRMLAQRPSTPWAAFAGAGLMSLVLFVLVFFSFAVTQAFIEAVGSMAGGAAMETEMNLDFGSMEIRGQTYDVTARYLLPWTLLPIFAAVAICRLSRSDPIGGNRLASGLGDGAALAALMTFIMIVTLALHVMMETEMVHRLFVDGNFDALTALQGVGFIAFLGFLIGYFIVPDVRKIAKTKI